MIRFTENIKCKSWSSASCTHPPTRKSLCFSKKSGKPYYKQSSPKEIDAKTLAKKFRKRLKILPENIQVSELEDVVKEFSLEIELLKREGTSKEDYCPVSPGTSIRDFKPQVVSGSPKCFKDNPSSAGKIGQVLICQGKDCCKRGSSQLMLDAKSSLKETFGDKLDVVPTRCMKRCEEGPTICVRPLGGRLAIYANITPENINRVVEDHLASSSRSVAGDVKQEGVLRN